MPRKIKNVTKDYLTSVALPNHGETYTVISHDSIIQHAYTELANQGFGIVDEEYRCTHDGQIAQGIYKLQYNTDPELSLMFAWTNSYNKQVRFKCAVGSYVNCNNTVMLSGGISSYARKHTGTADQDTVESMQMQIKDAMMYYDQLVDAKNIMKEITLTDRRQAELLGILFAEYEILTTEQASTVRQQMDKPSFFYNGGNNTLWSFYNHCTVALQQSHPRTWMEDQRMLHFILTEELSTSAVSVPETVEEDLEIVDPLYAYPGQTNILDQIAEMEAEDVVDLDAEEDEDWDNLEATGVIKPVVQYTDPVGNTFEAPLVIPEDKTFVEVHEEAMIEQVKEDTKVLEAMVWETEVTEEQEPFEWEEETNDYSLLSEEEKREDDDFMSFDLDFEDEDDDKDSSFFF